MMNPLTQFGVVFEPAEAQEPILGKAMRDHFLAWLTEIWAVKELNGVGIQPRRRAVFNGPPGTGKTTLAHHLAARLGMQMLLVGPEKINCRYVGASAEAVGRLFDAVSSHPDPIVLFFDEFDSVAAKRMESGLNEVGEQDHNLMINTLLARMDRFDGIVIAASNFDGRLDPAVWRRFEMHVTLPLPGQRERERILARYFDPFKLSKRELELLGEAFETASPSLMRTFCESIKRNIIVAPLANWDESKSATVSRILESVKPHPELGLPRLWSHGEKDLAILELQWPLSKEVRKDEVVEKHSPAQDTAEVVAFKPAGARQ